MVNKKLARIRAICPNKHEVITRKRINIQCYQCGIRFSIKEPLNPVLSHIAQNFIQNK